MTVIAPQAPPCKQGGQPALKWPSCSLHPSKGGEPCRSLFGRDPSGEVRQEYGDVLGTDSTWQVPRVETSTVCSPLKTRVVAFMGRPQVDPW